MKITIIVTRESDDTQESFDDDTDRLHAWLAHSQFSGHITTEDLITEAAPALLAAAKALLDKLNTMSALEFVRFADEDEREALRVAIGRAEGAEMTPTPKEELIERLVAPWVFGRLVVAEMAGDGTVKEYRQSICDRRQREIAAVYGEGEDVLPVARLIRAVPELLEAALVAYDALAFCDKGVTARKILRRAIDLATEEQE